MRVKERYELARELRNRYAAAGRPERGAILNGFCLATGYGRKYAIRVLRFALSTLPAVWVGQSPGRIVEGFAEALLRTLRVEFVYAVISA